MWHKTATILLGIRVRRHVVMSNTKYHESHYVGESTSFPGPLLFPSPRAREKRPWERGCRRIGQPASTVTALDLFSLHILFYQSRPHDTSRNSFSEISSSAQARLMHAWILKSPQPGKESFLLISFHMVCNGKTKRISNSGSLPCLIWESCRLNHLCLLSKSNIALQVCWSRP